MKTLMVVGLLILASIAYSQPEPMQHPDNLREKNFRGREFGPIEHLKLSDDQRKQFDGFTSALLKKQITLRSSIMSKQVDVRDLIKEEAPNKEKIEGLQNEISKLQSEIKINRTEFWFDVNRILKPEQQKEWKKMLSMGRRHHWMQEMKHRLFDNNPRHEQHRREGKRGGYGQMDPHDEDND